MHKDNQHCQSLNLYEQPDMATRMYSYLNTMLLIFYIVYSSKYVIFVSVKCHRRLDGITRLLDVTRRRILIIPLRMFHMNNWIYTMHSQLRQLTLLHVMLNTCMFWVEFKIGWDFQMTICSLCLFAPLVNVSITINKIGTYLWVILYH